MRLCWQDETLEHDDKYYVVSETEIKDKSMLGTPGEKLCDNLEVHWLTRICDADKNNRSKFVQCMAKRLLANQHA